MALDNETALRSEAERLCGLNLEGLEQEAVFRILRRSAVSCQEGDKLNEMDHEFLKNITGE